LCSLPLSGMCAKGATSGLANNARLGPAGPDPSLAKRGLLGMTTGKLRHYRV